MILDALNEQDIETLQRQLTPKLTKYIPYSPTPKQTAFLLMNDHKEVLYGGAAGGGKALALDTPILTSTGWKTMGSLLVGDKVYDETGSLCNVVAKSNIQYNHEVFEVVFDTAESIIADADHIWTLSQYLNRPTWKNMCTKEIYNTLGKRTKHAVPVADGIVGVTQRLPIPPYTLGAWLGDGASRCGDLASQDAEIYAEIRKDGFSSYEKAARVHHIEGLHTLLNSAGLLYNKHIPKEYLLASYDDRLALLHGLMDTDGNASSDRGYCSICMVKYDLMKDIEELVRSFGIKATLRTTQTGTKGPKYNLKWSTNLPMFRLQYKLDRQKIGNMHGTQKLHYIKNVKPVPSVPVQCIQVDSPSHLYLAGRSLVPTHNSVSQLMAALQFVDIPGYAAILFRKTYADLALPNALIDMSKQWLMPFVEQKEVRWSEKDKKYTFPSGATLSFGYLESVNDCYRYQGAEFQYIGMDEVTHIAPENYRYLFSRLRKPVNLNVPLRFRATANPGGEFGDYYYQRFFVEGEENGRIFVSATLNDNPYLDRESYVESLNELDPLERERLLNGNWDIRPHGGLFNRHWFQIVPGTTVPPGARRVRYWDLASTDPKKQKNKSRARRADPDYTVGLRMAMYQGTFYIEDIVREHVTPADAEVLIRRTAKQDGYSCAIRMEQEPGSSGAITIDKYARQVLPGYNFMGVQATGSKVDRARSVSAAAQQGNVLVVDTCRNILSFFDEADLFPYSRHDDTIDGLSGAFNYFQYRPVVVAAPSSIKKVGVEWSGNAKWGRIS